MRPGTLTQSTHKLDYFEQFDPEAIEAWSITHMRD